MPLWDRVSTFELCFAPCFIILVQKNIKGWIDLLKYSNFSDDFNQHHKNLNGIVCVFSLKNPAYPEYIRFTHCGISAVDIHPTHPHMLVAGLFDGNVAVFNLQKRGTKPNYISTAKNGKHQDTVWQVIRRSHLYYYHYILLKVDSFLTMIIFIYWYQVKWAKDDIDGYLNFHSVSGDGRISNWTIVKTSMWHTDILNIGFEKQLKNFDDPGNIFKGKAEYNVHFTDIAWSTLRLILIL